ncbi:hypothetical protein IFM89_005609 [Coptis chinensis]|uniref:CCR4-NOT transcription complex subunit 1 n=1 Tax=Coptis chinensis TaxID=261450 RepID=A0A835I5W8_9MAGN|nr:hypothetical protein IFM89_005609 [Coptis chinensis]
MIPFFSVVGKHIRYLIHDLNDSNYDSLIHDFFQIADYGSKGSILLLQTFLDHLYFHGGDVQNKELKLDCLCTIFRYLLNRPNFSTVLCESLRDRNTTQEFIGALSKDLCLDVLEKIAVFIALSDSEDPGMKTAGKRLCIVQIEELCSSPSHFDSNEHIQKIIMYLSQTEGVAKLLDSFMQLLSLSQLKQKTPFMLAPLLSDDMHDTNSLRNLDLFYECSENDFDTILAELEKDMSMADTMKELGYNCTVDASHCREMLSLFLPLTEVTLARLLSTIARTHTGLDDVQNTYSTFCDAIGSDLSVDPTWLSSWNVDVLLDSIKHLAPDTNWVHVMENMDHEGFYIPSREAFSVFMSFYASACGELFPLHSICGSVWKNTEGQLSFLRYAVSAPAEIFTFAHTSRKLVYDDNIHDQKLAHGPENQAWFCLDLLDILCQLAEMGHASSVRLMLEYPLKHCPEVLLVGIAHITTAFNLLQYEVVSTILPMVIRDGSRSGVILQLWHANRNLLLRGFMDIHSSDPENLNRILSLCLDSKIFPPVLDTTPFSFSIKLAALASGKEQWNLEKWLSDNLSTYKDTFFEECLKFLKDTPSGVSQDVPASPFQNSGAVRNVSSEISSIFFKVILPFQCSPVLQSQAGQNISRQLFEEMKRLHVASMHVDPRLQNGGAPDSSTSDGYPDDIEAEANSYFHQMFSGQLTIETMVDSLGHFKESTENRCHLV